MRIKSLVAAAALGVSALALAGCQTGFPTQVSRYQAMPAPQGQSFFVLPVNPAQSGGLEFNHFAGMVAQAMQAQGYVPAASPATASMIVHFNYGVDGGHTELVRDTLMYDPYRDPFGTPYARYGRPYYSRWGYYGARSPFYYGWDDPFYSPFGRSGYSRQVVFQSFVDVDIRRAGDNADLFEGHAKAKSTGNNLGVLVPNLVTAMFTNFPGQSGETVKIFVPNSKQVQRR
jgi:hypothetical protein